MRRTLVGGVGNVFLGDDGFGVEVIRRLAGRPRRARVDVADFGIRSIDLAYALLDDYEDVILVDAVPGDKPPGTLTVIEPPRTPPGAARGPMAGLGAHGFVPAQVFSLVAELGGMKAERVRIVGCEPAAIPPDGEMHMGLSEPVAGAIDRAVELVEALLAEGTTGDA